MAHKISVKYPDGQLAEFECEEDEYILDKLEEAGFDHDFSCRVGSCESCLMQLEEGEIDQSEQTYLDEEEVKEGKLLSCVAYPKSDCKLLGEQGG